MGLCYCRLMNYMLKQSFGAWGVVDCILLLLRMVEKLLSYKPGFARHMYQLQCINHAYV